MSTPLGRRTRLTRRELVAYLNAIQPDHRKSPPGERCPWAFFSTAEVWVLRRFALDEVVRMTGGLQEHVCYPEVVPRYRDMVTEAPPIVLDYYGGHHILDGYHRVLAAHQRHDRTIWAYVPVGVGTQR